MKILVVDDSPFFTRRLSDFLKDLDHDVIECNESTKSYDAFKANKPDLVFMDVLMPDMDGLTAMQTILADFPDARIIIVSSMGQQSKIIEAIQAGAMDFIVKPFEPSKVLASLEKIQSL